MKFATLKSGSRDGTLVLVSQDLQRMVDVSEYASNLQTVLDDWDSITPRLKSMYTDLNRGWIVTLPLDPCLLSAPLPRAYQWLDGSAYLSHVERVRKARGAEMPASFTHDPLMYQGGSDKFLGPRETISLANEEWGLDFEAEIAIVTDDVPENIPAELAGEHIKLVMLANDVSLRNLIPGELNKGFGFIQGKPASSFSPVAVTVDELGSSWVDSKLHLPLLTYLNGKPFGRPDAGKDMQFNFAALISHAAHTRSLAAGTIIGSGTVSNRDWQQGCSCIVEQRVVEIFETGGAITPYLRYGDRVRIEILNGEEESIFGAIDQQVEPCQG